MLAGVGLGPGVIKGLAAGKLSIGTQISFSPNPPVAHSPFSIGVQVTNKTSAAAPIAVQVAMVQANGQIGGHFWNALATAQQEQAKFLSGGPSAVANDQLNASLRVLQQQVAGGATDTFTLWSDPVQPGSYTFAVWAWMNPASGKLLATDSIGLTLAQVKLASSAVLSLVSQPVQVS